MNVGRWSLASLMKLVVDVCYYGALGVTALVCVLALAMRLGLGTAETVQLQVPVQFELDPGSHPFSTDQTGLQRVRIVRSNGSLIVQGGDWSRGLVWGGLGTLLIFLLTALFVLGPLRGLFRTLKDQNPFVAQNSARIRAMGIALIAGELAVVGLAAWLAARATSHISLAGVTFVPGAPISFWPLAAGVILIMLAQVFRLGAQMKGDLETARRIQFDLVPGEHFQKSDVVVQAHMRTARSVGGDYYDFFDLDEGRLGVVVGDVAGKGLPAALLMTSVVGSVRALLSAGLRGSDLIAALNRHVCTNTSGGRFVTLFYAELDAATGSLTYVNAGHNPPFLLRADGRAERLEPTAMVLGVMADAPVEARQAQMDPDGRLLLFTDGLSEAFDKKEEEYGDARAAASLARVQRLAPPAAMGGLIEDVLAFRGSVPLRDDMTLMLIARQPATA